MNMIAKRHSQDPEQTAHLTERSRCPGIAEVFEKFKQDFLKWSFQ